MHKSGILVDTILDAKLCFKQKYLYFRNYNLTDTMTCVHLYESTSHLPLQFINELCNVLSKLIYLIKEY